MMACTDVFMGGHMASLGTTPHPWFLGKFNLTATNT